MDELFNIPVCESPRLKWLKKHDVKTQHRPGINVGDEDKFGNALWPWEAGTSHGLSPERIDAGTFSQGGETEDEAIANLAKWQGWKLWNEEQVTPAV